METLIRLSTAHARARLSKNIEKQDADCAVELVQFAYFQKVLPKPKKRKHDGQEETDEEDEDVQPEHDEQEEEEQMEVDEDPQQEKPKKKVSKRKERKQSDEDQFEFEVSEKQQVEKSTEIIKLSEERMKKFRTFLFKEFRKTNAQSLPIPQIYQSAEKDPEIDFTKQEIDSALDYMQNELNQVFVSNNIVILI